MAPLLEVDAITTGYGRVEVLHGLSMAVPPGTAVAVLGPNGVGKTTLLKAVSGTLPLWRGAVRLDGVRVDGLGAHAIARRGVVLIPEGRGIFPGLSVADNLAVASRAARNASQAERNDRLERAHEVFPRLKERRAQRAGTLSGGEQQMLALSRAFLAEPRVLLMDEISMGLAPIIVDELFESVARLKASGVAMLIVEQFLTYALRLADICYVVGKGRVQFCGEPAELVDGEALQYLHA
ncbi:MAG: ABC transporter ATP-binding protein [Acidimicrobiales bacterium]